MIFTHICALYSREQAITAAYSKFMETCSKERGYCLNVRSVDIVRAFCTQDGLVCYTFEFDAEMFLPNEGDELEAVVTLVNNDGVFCKIKDRLSAICPARFCTGNFHVGQRIQVHVKKLRYQLGEFRAVVSP
jgi:DNA-directed RNA polymerase subunit E'/Rpb7